MGIPVHSIWTKEKLFNLSSWMSRTESFQLLSIYWNVITKKWDRLNNLRWHYSMDGIFFEIILTNGKRYISKATYLSTRWNQGEFPLDSLWIGQTIRKCFSISLKGVYPLHTPVYLHNILLSNGMINWNPMWKNCLLQLVKFKLVWMLKFEEMTSLGQFLCGILKG